MFNTREKLLVRKRLIGVMYLMVLKAMSHTVEKYVLNEQSPTYAVELAFYMLPWFLAHFRCIIYNLAVWVTPPADNATLESMHI